MKALVTGSAGFIGRHFVAELKRRGWEVEGIDLLFGGRPTGVDAFSVFDMTFPAGRHHYDLVVHAAARSPHRAAIDGEPISHIYNQHLDAAMFDWAAWTRQGRVLYLSSCAVLDDDLDDYGLLKWTGERMADQARRAGLPVTVVRPFSGYGEDQSTDFPFGAFVDRARRRLDPFPLWNPKAVRDWIHVADVVNGALAVAESGTTEPVSLCTGVGHTCGDVAERICETAGYRPVFEVNRDKPQGVGERIGDPTEMFRVYRPAITLAEGIKRALE